MVAELKHWTKKKLSWEETKKLILEYRKGNLEARDKIIKYNLWVIGTVNLQYGNTEDGFQQGILGLLEALKKYDVESKTQFSTYAYYWVRQSIDRYVNKNTYRTSHNLIFLHKKLQKFEGTEEEFFRINHLNEKTIIALKRMSSKGEYELEREADLEDKGSLAEINRFILKDYVDDILKRYCTPDEEKLLRAIFFKVHGESQLARELKCTRQWINAEKHRILSKLRGAVSK